jgi:predicted nucleic acid-binding Zn ribbon protein
VADQDIFSPSEWRRISDRVTVHPTECPSASTPKCLREKIHIRDGGICVYCKERPGTDCDHVIPASHGGPTIPENLVLACQSCNCTKSASFDLHFLVIAFNHLLYKGEDLDWVENVFLQLPEDVQEVTPDVDPYAKRSAECLHCGNRMYYEPEHQFCSDACEIAAGACGCEVNSAECLTCEKQMPVDSKNPFCSEVCAIAYCRRYYCRNCGNLITGEDRRFCSTRCQNLALRKLQRLQDRLKCLTRVMAQK